MPEQSRGFSQLERAPDEQRDGHSPNEMHGDVQEGQDEVDAQATGDGNVKHEDQQRGLAGRQDRVPDPLLDCA